MTTRILELSNFEASITSAHPVVPVVRGVSLDVAAGERVAIVGESGSGKTMLSLGIVGLLPRGIEVTGGEMRFENEQVDLRSDKALWAIRGSRIAMVFQDALNSLDPVITIGQQIADVVRRHDPDASRNIAKQRAVELLGDVGFARPETTMRSYVHQMSGGMRQRALIATALAGNPNLLIADEPTTALDVTVQAQILELLNHLVEDRSLAIVMITHDLGVVAEFADRVHVMYAGRFVESGAVRGLFAEPQHPYTSDLLKCSLRIDSTDSGDLATIPGQPPNPSEIGAGCAYAPRCSRQMPICLEVDPVPEHSDDRSVSCFAPIGAER